MNDTLHESRATKEPRLLDRVRDAIRRLHYSDRTEETYIHWIRRFIYFSGKRHPAQMGAEEVTAFLNHLARDREVAAATQNQALAALLFLYKEGLRMPLPWLHELERAKRPEHVPTVLTRQEVARLLGAMDGPKWLMASLLYGAGLRLRECLKLRVTVVASLQAHLARVKRLHERDLAEGYGDVELPHALARKYPRAHTNGAGSSCFRRASAPQIPRQA